MAADRGLPTLRISAEQLEERAKQIQEERKHVHGEFIDGVKHCHRSKDDAVSVRASRQVPGARTRTTIGNDQMAGAINPNRGRGQRRRGHVRVDEQDHTTRRGGRNKETDYNGHVPGRREEDLLTAWKRCCAGGGTEKLIASWMETRSRSKFTVILDAV